MKSFPFFLSILSGLFVGTSYIPFPGWALFFAYSPLWIGVYLITKNQNSSKKAFLAAFKLGWITQFILTLIGFNWIYYVSSEFGQLHPLLSAAALLLFAAFMHLYIPLAASLAAALNARFKFKPLWGLFICTALIHGLLERIWPSIFEWNQAYSLLWMQWPLYQWADVVGFWGLSTWILIFQAVIAYALIRLKEDRVASLISVGVLATVVMILFTVGHWKKQRHQVKLNQPEITQTLHLGVVQGNVGNAEKIQSEQGYFYQSHILNLYARLTDDLLKQFPETDLIFWPETALPFPLDQAFHSRKEQAQLLTHVQSWQRPVITGGYSVDLNQKDHLGNPLISNSIFYVGTNRQLIADTYNKTDLLAFGEYMPFGEQFPILYQWLPFVGVYKKGPGPMIYEIPAQQTFVKLGPQICYESLNPGFSRKLNQKKAHIIFNLTNDSWFGWWAEPYQHQIMTLARGIETRTPILRSTNTGITSAMLSDGTFLTNSPINKTWAHSFKLTYFKNPEVTFYTKWGYLDWVLWLIFLIYLIVLKTERKNVSN